MSAYRLIAYGSFTAGAPLGGWIASRVSIDVAFSFGGVLVTILALFMFRNLGPLDWARKCDDDAAWETTEPPRHREW